MSGLTETFAPEFANDLEKLKKSGKVKKMLFVAGPGDVEQNYRYWKNGEDDPSLLSVGYSHQVYEFAKMLDLSLLVLMSKEPVNKPINNEKVTFHKCWKSGGASVYFHLISIVYLLRVVGHAVRYRADVIFLQHNEAHIWVLVLARLMGIRLIVSLHNSLWPISRSPNYKEKIFRWLNGWLYTKACDRIICVSGAIASQIKDMPKFGATRVARTAVHIPQYKSISSYHFHQRAVDEPLKKIIYVGRIEEYKGVFDLLTSFNHISDNQHDISLKFIGEGSDVSKLKNFTELSPHAKNIHITGQLDASSLMNELAQADLLVCPTTSLFCEGLAKSPIEAMLLGVPALVSTNVPCAEILGEGVHTFPVDDIKALQNSIEGLIRHPEQLYEMNLAAKTRRGVFFDRKHSLCSQLLLALA